jgi:hypothetical protein
MEVTVKLIKTAGLAVVTALALAALGAGSASASQFRAEEYPTTVAGTQVVLQKFKTGGGLVAKCAVASTAGTESEASSALTVTPSYSECTVGGLGATLKANSCNYVLHSTNESAPFTGSMDISCSKEGDAIEAVQGGCSLKFPAQSSLGSVELQNTGSGQTRAIAATLNISGLKYTQAGCSGSNGTFENGTLTGSSTINSNQGKYAVGVYLAGEQIENPPHLFKSSQYPTLVESSASSLWITTNMASVKCYPMTSAGKMEGAAATLTQTYVSWGPESCTNSGGNFKMNGCNFSLHAPASRPPFTGAFLELSCASGKALTFSHWGTCPVTIPPQIIANSLTLENTGSGTSAGVHVAIGTNTLEYTEGTNCTSPGTHHNGQFSWTWNLGGYEFTGEEVIEGESHFKVHGGSTGLWVE